MYLFDTNALKLLIQGEPKVVQKVKENFAIVRLSSIAAEELLTGRMNGMNRARAPRTS